MVPFLRLTCSVVLWGGRNAANKYHWCLWGVLTMSQPHWVCPTHGMCAFPVYTASALGCSAGNCLRLALGCMHFLGLNKLLRFRHWGTPQRRRLGWACILCPSQVRAAQMTRCLVSVVAATYHLPRPCCSVFSAPSQADVDCPEFQEVLVSNEACMQFGR